MKKAKRSKPRFVADKPGATVLFTQEASGEILRRDVFKIDGQIARNRDSDREKPRPELLFGGGVGSRFRGLSGANRSVRAADAPAVEYWMSRATKRLTNRAKPALSRSPRAIRSGKPARAEVSLALD